MKKILLIISALTLTVACQKETPVNGDRSVQIRLSTGGSIGTRAPEPEYSDVSIKTVDILVFNNSSTKDDHSDATYLYSRYAWQKSGDIYSTTLKEGTDLDLYFAINARSVVNGAALTEGTTWADVQKKLVMSGPINRSANGLPMWGYRYNESISSNAAANNFGIIKVLRSIASADIYMTATNFTLEAGSAEFAANQGYLAFIVGDNVDYDDDELLSNYGKPQYDYYLKSPLIPVANTTNGTPATTTTGQVLYSTVAADNNNILNQLYFYENDGPDSETSPTNGRTYTKIVLAGKYDPTPTDNTDNADLKTTYYPLAFRDTKIDEGTSSNDRVPIIRNRKFEFRITNVNGPGYKNIDDARAGNDLNMTYDVIEWDTWTDVTIVVGADGKYLSIAPSRNEGLVQQASLYRNATSTDEFTFTTDIDIDKFELALSESGAKIALTDDEKDAGYIAKIANAYYEVVLIQTTKPAKSGDKYQGKFLVTAKQNYDPARDPDSSTLTVTAGLVELSLEIFQRNASLEDWIDGGDQPWTAKGEIE